jgi:uncharacterized protein (TIGR02271 family)
MHLEETMVDQTVVALFDDAASARKVLEELQAAGLDHGRFQITGDTIGTSATGTAGSGSSRLTNFGNRFSVPSDRIASLVELGVPEDDAHIYAEGVRRGGTLLIGEVNDDTADRALNIIEGHTPVDIAERGDRYRSSGWSRYDAGADYTTEQAATERSRYGSGLRDAAADLRDTDRAPATGNAPRADTQREVAADREETIPVVEEQISIQKRAVERGRVRIHTRVIERPIEEQVSLHSEHVSVERRPVDPAVQPVPPEAFRDRTIEVTETAEEAVVHKDARIREEVVIRKEAEERAETVRDTVRRTEVDVEDDRNRMAGGTEGPQTEIRETGAGVGMGTGATKPSVGERTREAGHDAAADMKENRGLGGKIADAARDMKEDLKGKTGSRTDRTKT